jgi:hypothetical protein
MAAALRLRDLADAYALKAVEASRQHRRSSGYRAAETYLRANAALFGFSVLLDEIVARFDPAQDVSLGGDDTVRAGVPRGS